MIAIDPIGIGVLVMLLSLVVMVLSVMLEMVFDEYDLGNKLMGIGCTVFCIAAIVIICMILFELITGGLVIWKI